MSNPTQPTTAMKRSALQEAMAEDQPKPTGKPCDCEGYNEDGRLICKKERGHDTDLPMPKPTGEWTAENVATLLKGNHSHPAYQHDVQAVAGAHNAQIVAERERADLAYTKGAKDQHDEDMKQLATERKKREREMADYETLCGDLQQQLATEREKRELAESLFQQRDKEMTENLTLAVEIEKERNQLRQQLAAEQQLNVDLNEAGKDLMQQLLAEREKVQIVMRYIPACSQDAVNDALAKVGR